MKVLCFALLFLPTLLTAAVLRVNNMPDTSPNYTTIQAAINAAADGDTLLIEGSVTSYAAFTLTNKRLNIIGPGYGLSQNLGTPANKLSATIAGSTTSLIRTSSASGGSANGTLVMGLEFLGTLQLDLCANVTVARCALLGSGRIEVNGPQCVITQVYGAPGTGISYNSNASGLRVENCVIPDGAISWSGSNITGVVFRNNLMRGFSDNGLMTVENNIFTSSVSISSGSVYRNNLFSSSVPSPIFGSGNLAYTSTLALMPSYSTSIPIPGTSFDSRYRLGSAPNAALNAGTDGTHIGPFGGTNPYVLSGVPPLPTIDELSVPQFSAPGTNLTIRVKVSARP
jgi:hypothetical protein